MILAIRTDKPEAEISLYKDGKELKNEKWEAHRSLATTLHSRIKQMLDSAGADWHDISGIIYFKGPGSFTGLRIGAALANSLAYANNVPLVGANGENWIELGLEALKHGKNQPALPEYGADPHITSPRK